MNILDMYISCADPEKISRDGGEGGVKEYGTGGGGPRHICDNVTM